LHLVHGTPSPKTRQKNSAPGSKSVGLQDVETELPPNLQHCSFDKRSANKSLHKPFLPIDAQHMPPVTEIKPFKIKQSNRLSPLEQRFLNFFSRSPWGQRDSYFKCIIVTYLWENSKHYERRQLLSQTNNFIS